MDYEIKDLKEMLLSFNASNKVLPVYKAEIDGDELKACVTRDGETYKVVPKNQKGDPLTGQELRQIIGDIDLREWKKRYRGTGMMKNVYWHLELYFGFGKRFTTDGDEDTYPKNFAPLLNAFGITSKKDFDE